MINSFPLVITGILKKYISSGIKQKITLKNIPVLVYY